MIPDAATGRGPSFSTPPRRGRRAELLRAALDYAGQGTPVFPCKPDKSPYWAAGVLEHGHLDATTDRSRITAWWNRWPEANIGMPTGKRSGVFVLDVDELGALAELEAGIGKLPATRTVRTPSGGLHLYFHHVEGITNSPGALPDGIDVRGEGGYVLVPPSSGYRSEALEPIR